MTIQWNDELEERAKDLVASSLHRLSNADLIDAAPDLLESALAEIQRLRDALRSGAERIAELEAENAAWRRSAAGLEEEP
jgi:hypothetical protein